MPVPNWLRTADWETLYLSGKRVPGVARVEVSYDSGIDIQKPRKAKKAKVRDTGTPPANISVTISLLAEEMEELDSIISLLRPKSAFASRSPLTITHPNCALWGINQVLVGNVRSPQPGAGGSYELEFSAVEYVDEPKKLKKKAKAPTEDPSEWDVDPLIDALRPARGGAVGQNFSDPNQLESIGPP